MKKISLYFLLALVGMLTTACNEDFKDWNDPQSWPQEDAIVIPGFAATAGDVVDLNAITADDTVRIFNQLLKVVSVAIGTYIAVGRGQEGGLLRGALIGLLYMALGVAAYALLSGQGAPWTAYLADLAMGTATGGIIGAIVSNISGK